MWKLKTRTLVIVFHYSGKMVWIAKWFLTFVLDIFLARGRILGTRVCFTSDIDSVKDRLGVVQMTSNTDVSFNLEAHFLRKSLHHQTNGPQH